MNDAEIEIVLRKAPSPEPPANLLEQLRNEIHVNQTKSSFQESTLWQQLLRWWPATVCLLIGITVAAGQIQTVKQLRGENESLRTIVAELERLRSQNAEYLRLAAIPDEVKRLESELAEIQTLKTEIASLRNAQAEGVNLAAENARLAGSLNLPVGTLPEATFSKGKRINCINNLKNIGLAARIWASDHHNNLPTDFLSMKDELNTPKILHCPSDDNRAMATNWDNFSETACSYEILSPGVSAAEGQVVYVRCRVHEIFGLADGAVMQNEGGRVLAQKDGKWILETREN
jgi:hypothetical protein